MQNKVSVIVPAFNEVDNLPALYEELCSVFEGLESET